MRQHTRDFLNYLRERRKLVMTTFALLVLILIIGAISDAGGRLLDALGLQESGTLKIETPGRQTTVYLDGDILGVSSSDELSVAKEYLAVGKYEVLTTRPNFHPWRKSVLIEATSTTTIRPFHLPQDPPTRAVRASSTAREIRRAIARNTLPRYLEPRISDDTNVAVWVEGGAVHARWLGDETTLPPAFCYHGECRARVTVTPTVEPIRDLAFYKNRHDVLLLAADRGVYGLEIDAGGATQNFQPLYEGTEPRFIKTGTSSIIVRDQSELIRIAY